MGVVNAEKSVAIATTTASSTASSPKAAACPAPSETPRSSEMATNTPIMIAACIQSVTTEPDVLAEQELAARDRLREDRVDRAPLDLPVDQPHAHEDRDGDARRAGSTAMPMSCRMRSLST